MGNLAVSLAVATTSFEIEPDDLRMVEELDAFIGSACRRVAEIQRHRTLAHH